MVRSVQQSRAACLEQTGNDRNEEAIGNGEAGEGKKGLGQWVAHKHKATKTHSHQPVPTPQVFTTPK